MVLQFVIGVLPHLLVCIFPFSNFWLILPEFCSLSSFRVKFLTLNHLTVLMLIIFSSLGGKRVNFDSCL